MPCAGDDDCIDWRSQRRLRLILDKLRADAMRCHHVAGENAGYLPCFVNRNVEIEIDTRHQGNLCRFLVERISIKYPNSGLRMLHQVRAVHDFHRLY